MLVMPSFTIVKRYRSVAVDQAQSSAEIIKKWGEDQKVNAKG